MRAVDIIIKKRDGGELSKEEIEFFVRGIAEGTIPDYQIAAWAMAVLLRGMSARETADLTLAMAASGDQLDLSDVVPVAVDKHSTGGVGDKTTLVVLPVVAACGVPVAKMSGRGLSFTGGTLDKMESIPGFQVDLTIEQIRRQVRQVGLVLAGQTAELAPADGKLYALRDVTGTVPSIPLIASSVMSKKIAAGAKAIVLDVKVGSGAFMKDLDQARSLAELMVAIGRQVGLPTVALLADMNQPLGRAVGNALEVWEAIETLRGGGHEDLREHCLVVASHMLRLGGAADTLGGARALAEKALEEGRALDKFQAMVEAQGGDGSVIEDPDRLPKAELVETILAPRGGYLAKVDALQVGLAALHLGAGREKKGDPVDHAVGVVVHHKVGDQVDEGEPLFTMHANDWARLVAARRQLEAAVEFSEELVEPLPLFYGVVE
jgi:pyrimidine-nucleoside phosphorylase